MKKLLAVLLILTATFLTACGGESPGEQGGKHGDVIVIGIDDEFAPMAFRDEHNELVGFDIDLAVETARRMGVKIVFKPIDWNNKREEITSGKVDIIWNGLNINDERREYMIFSKPYMEDRQILLVNKGNTQDIRSEYDLAGKRVGTQAGSTAETFITADEKLKNNFAALNVYGKIQEALNALSSNNIDAIACDEIIARYEMSKHPNQFEIIDIPTGKIIEMGIGFRKDEAKLRDSLQKAFDDIVEDGTAKRISEKWFDADLIKK